VARNVSADRELGLGSSLRIHELRSLSMDIAICSECLGIYSLHSRVTIPLYQRTHRWCALGVDGRSPTTSGGLKMLGLLSAFDGTFSRTMTRGTSCGCFILPGPSVPSSRPALSADAGRLIENDTGPSSPCSSHNGVGPKTIRPPTLCIDPSVTSRGSAPYHRTNCVPNGRPSNPSRQLRIAKG
jgi:hypothetical protein